MGALAPLNLLVVFGSQLPAKSFAEDVKGNVMEAPCTPTSDNRRGSCGARRRRPVALPAVDVMASFCMLSHGCYGPLEASTQGMMDNFSHCGDPAGEGCHPDDAGLMNPTYPKEPPILLSPPTPSKPSKPKQVNPELEKMCQEAFSDMVLLPRSAVDLNLKLKWRPSKAEVSKIILELTRDNVAALAVIATLSLFGLIYLWKICTRKSCSCKLCRNQYRTLDLLGAGGYGSVYLVERLPDLERYVSKKIPVREITEVDEYSREAKELVLLRHKHIVSYEEDFVHIEYGGFEPKTYSPEAAYGLAQKGFWTSDTCDESRTVTPCNGAEKFIEVVFSTALNLRKVRIQQAASNHPQDFLRNGTLEVGGLPLPRVAADQPHCDSYQAIAPVVQREVAWSGALASPAHCLRIRMLAAQKEWIMLKFVEVSAEVGPITPAAAPAVKATPSNYQELQQELPSVASTTVSARDDQTVTEPLTFEPSETSTVPAASTALSVPLSPLSRIEEPSSTYRAPLAKLNAIVHSMEEPNQDTLACMLAFSVGLLAGITGWANVFLCQALSLPGVHLVGRLPCWMSSFVPAIDSMLFLSLEPPSVYCSFREKDRKLARETGSKMHLTWWSSFLVMHQAPEARRLFGARSWEEVQSPARRSDPARFQVVGSAHLRRWLAIGLSLRCEQQAAMDKAVEVLKKLLAAGDASLVVVAHLSDELPEQRSRLAGLLEQELRADVEAGRFLAVRAPDSFYNYQDLDRKADNYELAVLLTSAVPLADHYMQVEADVLMKKGFMKTLQSYVASKEQQKEPWHMISLSQDGHRRKIWRSTSLFAFAGILTIFPDVPPDSLVWDFLDTINNQSAPKACVIASLATKVKRADVLLQYHKAEALIEHVGDVSSLEGKVQRIHDDYFKKHSLISSLFDNPAADIYTADAMGASSQLQATYGSSGISTGQPNVKVGTLTVKYLDDMVGHGQAVLELVFKSPTTVQMINLRLGGHLRPKTNKKQKVEDADPDFDFVLDHARIEFGRGRHPGATPAHGAHVTYRNGRCTDYEPVVNISGREVFWRCPESRLATAVECVKVTLQEPQQKAVIIRSIRIRSGKPRRRLSELDALDAGDLNQADLMVDLENWQGKMVTWSISVSAAFFAGCLVFVVGCAATSLHVPGLRRRELKRRTKVSQA